MKPLNAAARKKTFTNFLIFFIVTIIAIVSTIFFSIQVPLKQNEQLRERISIAQSEQFFSAAFSDKMNTALKYLDSVNMKEAQPRWQWFDAAIDQNITDLNKMVLTDSSANKNLYQGIASSLSLLQQAKKQLREASGKDNTLDDQTKKILDLNSQITNLQGQLQMYKATNPQHQ